MPIQPDLPVLEEQLRSMEHEDLVQYACRLAASMEEGQEKNLQLSYPDNLLADILAPTKDADTYVKPYDINGSLAYVIAALTEREQTVLKRRYQERMTYKAIGEEFGCSGSRVQQILAKSLRKMRHPSRYRYITRGIQGYIGALVDERIESMTDKFETLYQRNYERGYAEGYADAIAKEAAAHETPTPQDTPLEDLNLSVRAYNCLFRANIKTLSAISKMTGNDLLAVRNMGRKCVQEVIDVCATYGITITPPGG